METTINAKDVSTNRTTLVGRSGQLSPETCAYCGRPCHDFIRVHCVHARSIQHIQYNCPCYWACDDGCARAIARQDIHGMTFR